MSYQEQVLGEKAERFLSLLLKKDVLKASALVKHWHTADKVPLRSIYLDVFAASQTEVGKLWMDEKINVAQEHFCTVATQMIMSQLYPYLFNGEPKDSIFVGVCAQGNQHELPMRMVTDFFEMEGWDSHYLGASLPVEDVVSYLKETPCDVLGVSATLDEHIPPVKRLIEACREELDYDFHIMVGGMAFNLNPKAFDDVGADALAADAHLAVEQAKQWLEAS